MRTIAVFACMILCWISVPSHAAEISCAVRAPSFPSTHLTTQSGKFSYEDAAGFCIAGFLHGPIGKGDYEKVIAFLDANRPNVALVFLNSPGGSVEEAIKIGRVFRKYLLSTTAPWPDDDGVPYLPSDHVLCRGQHCNCASACALIFFGGVGRTGTVGLHRPWSDDPAFRTLSPANASTAYRQILERVTAYLDEMEVPKSIIEATVATSSGDIRWVDAIDNGLDRPPSIAEWEDASCGSRPVSDYTSSEYLKHITCEEIILGNHRE